MLVLTRKCQEAVVVGGADGLEALLKVTVLGIEKGKVRLGFEAGNDVPVHRLEVWERIRAIAPIFGSVFTPKSEAPATVAESRDVTWKPSCTSPRSFTDIAMSIAGPLAVIAFLRVKKTEKARKGVPNRP